jgi:hypothetical protein
MGAVLVPIPIPILGGAISGGEAITIDSLEDLASLRGLCAAVPGIRQLFEQIKVQELRARFQDLRDDWIAHHETYDLDLLTRIRRLEPNEMEHIDQIQLVLGIAEAVWAQEEPGPDCSYSGLSLVLAIAEVGATLEMETEEPALIWSEGSILSRLIGPSSTAFTAGAWCIALARGQGASPIAIAHDLMEGLRTARRNHIPPDETDLLDLGRLDSDAVTKAKSLRFRSIVVFIHGLLSSDLGTFDGFLHEFRRRQKDPGVLFLGWPHDTLTGIWDNAQHLAEQVTKRIGTQGPDLVFVCHSRGGLVARAAAMRLYQIDPKYRGLVKGAVTFGTPHDGSSLAGAGTPAMLGHFVSINAATGTRSIWRLSDLLLYRKQQQNKTIQGIEDLRLPAASGFISGLRKEELEDPKKPAGEMRQLPLCCVGGDYKGPMKGQMALAHRYFGKNLKHDLVVELESSTSRAVPRSIVVNCSHFNYCSEPMRQSSGFRAAVQVAIGWTAGR